MADALTEFEGRYPEYPQAARAMLKALKLLLANVEVALPNAYDLYPLANARAAIAQAEQVGITTGEDEYG